MTSTLTSLISHGRSSVSGLHTEAHWNRVSYSSAESPQSTAQRKRLFTGITVVGLLLVIALQCSELWRDIAKRRTHIAILKAGNNFSSNKILGNQVVAAPQASSEGGEDDGSSRYVVPAAQVTESAAEAEADVNSKPDGESAALDRSDADNMSASEESPEGDQEAGGEAVAERPEVSPPNIPKMEKVTFDPPDLRTWPAEKMLALGRPEDSFNLPHQPIWDPSTWEFNEMPDPESPEWPNTVAICAMMKDEHPDDVAEWLQYHRWLGVDHVFLVENAEEVPAAVSSRVQKYVDSGFLNLGVLPGEKHPTQNRWYNRCSKQDMAGQHSWVVFLDLDEFLMVMEEGVAAKDPDLKAVLKLLKSSPGFALQWILFGSSGHVERPPGGPIGNYHKCDGQVNWEYKCMANMFHAANHILVSDTVHNCAYRVINGDFQNPPVTLGDGTPLDMHNTTALTNPNDDPALGLSRGYRKELPPDTYDSTLTKDYKLVLFHYTTRSLADYLGVKAARHSGIYADSYKRLGTRADIKDPVVMQEFERVNGFDREDPVCSSAVGLAQKCCSDT